MFEHTNPVNLYRHTKNQLFEILQILETFQLKDQPHLLHCPTNNY